MLLVGLSVCGFLQANVTIAQTKTPKPAPYLLGERELERTGFQQSGPYSEKFDLRTDFVMPYGISDQAIGLLQRWKDAGYVLHLMTGVAWGGYEDYLDGKFDGIDHWDDAQCDPASKQILHGPRVPYMVPSIAFANYLEAGLKKAIDAGVVAVHLEEPEFWTRAGYSDSFKREWQIYYNEPWERPDSSCDAQYRASKLKQYLYRRTLDRLCSSLKEYSLKKYQRPVRFYVPTHSLLNYSQWQIVSPESALLDLPGIDGLIAQVWTGTARTPNVYQGVVAERTFETAYLEYCIMQEMVRGTNKRMYFLHDPIEDNPNHDWNDYRRNYICTLTASLLQPDTHYYEVCPWPSRVMNGKYPAKSPNAVNISPEYATTLMTAFQQLRDMDQPDVSWEQGTDGIGVFLGDSAMFQRIQPDVPGAFAQNKDDATRPTRDEIGHFSAFYGITIPLVKHGVPVRAVQLDNVLRYPGYLDRYKVLVLSYEFQKPLHPGIHQVLADWVSRGGILVYIGADTDPFHQARDWWNQAGNSFASPAAHLFETLSLGRVPQEGNYVFGKGNVFVVRKHPAYFSRSQTAADEYRQLIRNAVEKTCNPLIERNYFLLRRGPCLIAATMHESCSETPLQLLGNYVDLLDAKLPVLHEVTVPPGEQKWLIDLDHVTANAPAVLAASGRVENWDASTNGVSYTISSPSEIRVATRILLVAEPKSVTVADQKLAQTDYAWDAGSATLFLQHAGSPQGIHVAIEW